MSRAMFLVSVACLTLGIPAWAAGAVPAETVAPITPAVVAQQYDRIVPAICVITYSYEMTNPGSGEKSKNTNTALGLIVSSNGLVMARGHMNIENVEPFNIRVKVGRGGGEKEYSAKLLTKPDDVNVCFVQIEAKDNKQQTFPAVRFTRGKALKVGEPLLLVGMLGETLDYTPLAREARIGAILTEPRTTYVLDEPMLPMGFIGCPAIDGQGQLVGVMGYDLTPNEGGDLYVHSGYPLLFQSDLFAKYIDAPPTEKTENQPKEDSWLGIFTQPLTDDLAEYWNLDKTGGVVVATLVPGGPGEQGGLQRGDIIKAFNNVPIKTKQNRDVVGFTKLVRETPIGKPVPLKVLRNGQPTDVNVTLAGRPKSSKDAEEFEDQTFGLTVREITTDVRIRMNMPEDVKGVIVWRVKSGSWAALANIRPGVVILRFGDIPVANLAEFKVAIAKAAESQPSEVAVFARVGARTGFFRMMPRWESNVAK
ncbi:MAG: PDZ domain-containing protein [Candidatus Hydrogenedentes bacterium]|nr:PDZ domain-containing protein [Candidatus Hydrogenedentota bacterium]